MLRPRIIPCLLIKNKGLVKTVNFSTSKYVGDPINAVKIFNEKEVDELIVLDIDATVNQVEPDYKVIQHLAAECRMPFSYGGGIKTVEQAKRIIKLGVEKVSISSAAIEQPDLITKIAEYIGGQSVVVVMDVKKNIKKDTYEIWTHNGKKNTGKCPIEFAQQVEAAGVGEIVINSIDHDGVMKGYELPLVKKVRAVTTVPMTVLGGAGSLKDIEQLIHTFGIIGASAGSLFVFKGIYKAVLIKTHRSLVSLGTEKMLVEFGKANLLSKARQQPEKVKQVLDKIKTEGLLPTLEAVFNKLDEPLPLGYCNAGEVIAVGEGVMEFKVGDRIASNGPHAEVVCIPKNLCANIPENVSYEEAAFTIIGSIGLQGIRLVNPTMGETVVVIGLGLIGLITAEMLITNGCNVIGFDFDESKIQLAKKSGVQAFNASTIDVVKTVEQLTNSIGADAVIITASTKENEVISQAANMSRKRGRIVLVGVIGLNIQRADFYKKELSFQVSCSYGPGRYDEDYEQKGIDYPLPYVRWTEKRNFETVLNAIAQKKLNVQKLITERVPLNDYLSIYGNMGKGSIASMLEYPIDTVSTKNTIKITERVFQSSKGVIGIIGAGNFTKMTIMPTLKGSGAVYKYIASVNGLTASTLAKKYGFEYSTSDYKEILKDSEVDLVLITTRHNLHAQMVVECLQHGKHVFVEKPLALTNEELNNIITAYQHSDKALMVNVGFNRRFSPHIQKAKQLLGNNAIINVIATMNTGFIPPDIWVHDLKIGGGRILGEACHFVDVMIYLAGSKITEVVMSALGSHPETNTDNAIITLKFENGSQGVINYFANGNKSYSKERIEIYSGGQILIVDNFRKMKGYGFKNFSSMRTRLDKGHKTQFHTLIKNVKEGKGALIPFDELINTTKATIAAIESLQKGTWINIQ